MTSTCSLGDNIGSCRSLELINNSPFIHHDRFRIIADADDDRTPLHGGGSVKISLAGNALLCDCALASDVSVLEQTAGAQHSWLDPTNIADWRQLACGFVGPEESRAVFTVSEYIGASNCTKTISSKRPLPSGTGSSKHDHVTNEESRFVDRRRRRKFGGGRKPEVASGNDDDDGRAQSTMDGTKLGDRYKISSLTIPTPLSLYIKEFTSPDLGWGYSPRWSTFRSNFTLPATDAHQLPAEMARSSSPWLCVPPCWLYSAEYFSAAQEHDDRAATAEGYRASVDGSEICS